jgi:hypothetical protein
MRYLKIMGSQLKESFLDFKLLPCVKCNVFFWVFPRRLSTNSWSFGTLYQFHLQRQFDEVYFIELPLKMEPIECSETSAIISTQMPGKHTKENILQKESCLFQVIPVHQTDKTPIFTVISAYETARVTFICSPVLTNPDVAWSRSHTNKVNLRLKHSSSLR